MSSLVLGAVGAVGERFRALGILANVGTLTGVGALMDLQVLES
jgi:hypothetical protein